MKEYLVNTSTSPSVVASLSDSVDVLSASVDVVDRALGRACCGRACAELLDTRSTSATVIKQIAMMFKESIVVGSVCFSSTAL